MSDTAKLYKIKEVAQKMGVAEVTIRTWLAERRLEFIRLGRCVRISSAEVERLIADGTVPARVRR